VVLWAGLAGESTTVSEVVATLDPSAPDVLGRDVEVIWQARAATAFMTNDLQGIDQARSWLDEREPRCANPITEAWILSNLMAGTVLSPDPAVLDRAQRLKQSSRSPSIQAIVGFSQQLHLGLEPDGPAAGGDRHDGIDELQGALAHSRAAGNTFVEATCMVLMANPLSERGQRGDAVALRATVDRLRDVRYDLAFQYLVARLAIWLFRVGRPEGAAVLDGYFRAHTAASAPIQFQPMVEQLDRLLADHQFPTARARGIAMSLEDLTDYLHAELDVLADDIEPEETIAPTRR
jgi:hypothetical protein